MRCRVTCQKNVRERYRPQDLENDLRISESSLKGSEEFHVQINGCLDDLENDAIIFMTFMRYKRTCGRRFLIASETCDSFTDSICDFSV